MIKKLICFGIILLVVFSLSSCASTPQGIPKGTYERIGEDGEITGDGISEGAWKISREDAEHRYLKYKIIEESDKIYFEYDCEKNLDPHIERDGFRYEVSYDDETKIITVLMPAESSGSPVAWPSFDHEIVPFRFKYKKQESLFIMLINSWFS